MDAIDWDAFLKGWQGQPSTAPTSPSESNLLTSSVENAGPILSKPLSIPSKEPIVDLSLESVELGFISSESFSFPSFDEVGEEHSPPFPKTDKDQQPDEQLCGDKTSVGSIRNVILRPNQEEVLPKVVGS